MLWLNADRAVLLSVELQKKKKTATIKTERREKSVFFFFLPHRHAEETKWRKSQVTVSLVFCSRVKCCPMSKWQMTTSQAVSIRLNSVACGRFTLVDSPFFSFFKKGLLWWQAWKKLFSLILAFFAHKLIFMFGYRIFQCFPADKCREDSYHHHHTHTSPVHRVTEVSDIHQFFLYTVHAK